jgi:hypothetical protein
VGEEEEAAQERRTMVLPSERSAEGGVWRREIALLLSRPTWNQIFEVPNALGQERRLTELMELLGSV